MGRIFSWNKNLAVCYEVVEAVISVRQSEQIKENKDIGKKKKNSYKAKPYWENTKSRPKTKQKHEMWSSGSRRNPEYPFHLMFLYWKTLMETHKCNEVDKPWEILSYHPVITALNPVIGAPSEIRWCTRILAYQLCNKPTLETCAPICGNGLWNKLVQKFTGLNLTAEGSLLLLLKRDATAYWKS